MKTSVIRQKGESQNSGYKNMKRTKFSERLLPPDTHIYVSGGKKCLNVYSENLACFIFLYPPFLDSRFSFVTDKKYLSKKNSFRQNNWKIIYFSKLLVESTRV